MNTDEKIIEEVFRKEFEYIVQWDEIKFRIKKAISLTRKDCEEEIKELKEDRINSMKRQCAYDKRQFQENLKKIEGEILDIFANYNNDVNKRIDFRIDVEEIFKNNNPLTNPMPDSVSRIDEDNPSEQTELINTHKKCDLQPASGDVSYIKHNPVIDEVTDGMGVKMVKTDAWSDEDVCECELCNCKKFTPKKEKGCGKEFYQDTTKTYPHCSTIQGLCPECKEKEIKK